MQLVIALLKYLSNLTLNLFKKINYHTINYSPIKLIHLKKF